VADWSLEGELKKLASQDDLPGALLRLGMIDCAIEEFELSTEANWWRSGVETYSLVFRVARVAGSTKYFMKACVAFADASLEQIFASWLDRRSVVKELGLSVPRLYAASPALLVEEYVDFDLYSALKHSQDRSSMLKLIGEAAGKLASRGFTPLSVGDWRSRGSDVVLIDFGQDLGPPGMTNSAGFGLLSEIIERIEGAGVMLCGDDLRLMERAFGET
jgi:hypothetical protein